MHIYDLPNDILHLIVSHLAPALSTPPTTALSPINPDHGFALSNASTSTAALAALTRTSKLFNQHATPLLYRRITLSRGAKHDAATHHALLSLVAPDSRLPQFIRELRFKGWGIAACGSWMVKPYNDALCGLAVRLLSKAHRLEDVYWEDYPNWDIFSAIGQAVRLHVRAQRVADAWAPFWPYVLVYCEQLTSLSLLRFTGHAGDVRDVLVRSPNLEHFEITRVRTADPVGGALVGGCERRQMPRLKSLRYYNGPLHRDELEEWAKCGGFEQLELLATDHIPLVQSVLDAGVRSLHVFDFYQEFGVHLAWIELIRQQRALHHLRIAMTEMDVMEVFQEHALSCPHLVSLASRSTLMRLGSMGHLREVTPLALSVVGDAGLFPKLVHAAADLHIDQESSLRPEPPRLRILSIALAPRITHLTLYISPGPRSENLAMAASRKRRKILYDSLNAAKAGSPLTELTIRLGTEDLEKHGLSIDQLQAAWSRNDQCVYILRADEAGDVTEKILGFEDVWGECDTMPNDYVIPDSPPDEANKRNTSRSVYDKVSDSFDP